MRYKLQRSRAARRKKTGVVFSSLGEGVSKEAAQMGNEPEVKESFDVEDAPGADAILRKMAKRALPDLQVKHVTGAAKRSCPAQTRCSA